jgi:predicted RecA/RadA family phage recombinase
MALNRVREHATRLALPVPDGTESGAPLVIGSLPCVAVTDQDEWTEGEASVQTDGSWRLEVGVATDVGDEIFWHDGNPDTLNKTASGGKHFGYALEAQGAGGVIEVKVGY